MQHIDNIICRAKADWRYQLGVDMGFSSAMDWGGSNVNHVGRYPAYINIRLPEVIAMRVMLVSDKAKGQNAPTAIREMESIMNSIIERDYEKKDIEYSIYNSYIHEKAFSADYKFRELICALKDMRDCVDVACFYGNWRKAYDCRVLQDAAKAFKLKIYYIS